MIIETLTGFFDILIFILFSANNDVALGILLIALLVVGFAAYGAFVLARSIFRAFRKGSPS